MLSDRRIGALLVAQGLLKPDQLQQVLLQQDRTGQPLGRLAAEVLHVPTAAVFQALAERLLGSLPRVDIESCRIDPGALPCVSRIEAWTHRVLPVSAAGPCLILATCPSHLSDALQLIDTLPMSESTLVLAEEEPMTRAILQHYGVWCVDRLHIDRCRAA